MQRSNAQQSSDNGPEYISGKPGAWASKHDINLDFIQLGNPQQNAYIKRYNRTMRYDWLAQYVFESIAAVQDLRLNGSGTTITNDLIWGLVVLPLNKSWP